MMLYFAQLGVLIQFRVNHVRWIEAQTALFCLDILVIYSGTLTLVFYISFILRVRHLITTTRPDSCRCCCLIQIYQPYRGLNNNNPNPQARLPAAVQTNLVPRVLSPTRPYGVREAGRRENLGTRLCPNVWTSASSPQRGRWETSVDRMISVADTHTFLSLTFFEERSAIVYRLQLCGKVSNAPKSPPHPRCASLGEEERSGSKSRI